MQNTLSIDTEVVGVGSPTATYHGRQGTIVEIDHAAGRYRVRWITEPSGRPVNRLNPANGTRTWVKFECVEPSK